MPALLIIKKISPTVETSDTWLAGQIVQVYDGAPSIGGGAAPSANSYVQYQVTDKTKAEMDEFLARYDKAIQMAVFQGPDPQGLRSIHVKNLNTNASGDVGEWTVEQADRIIEEWNTLYPTTGLITLGFPAPDTWDCQGTFTTGQAIEFESVVVEKGLNAQDMRKIWYIPAVVMSNIIGNGGTQTGTSAQLQMRDARLD